MKSSRVIEAISLLGVLLSVFAFVFWPWDRGQSGPQSGLSLVFSLAKYLAYPDLPLDGGRRQAIFSILILFTVALILQCVLVYGILQAKGGRWAAFLSGIAFVGIVLLGVLFFIFTARTLGVVLTTMGEMLVLGGAVALVIKRRRFFDFPDRNKAFSKASKAFGETFKRANSNQIPLALLAMETSQTLGVALTEFVMEELRADDRVFPLKDGVYILLWRTDETDAINVAHHLQNILLEKGQISSFIGISSFPNDGTQIEQLIEQAERALVMAKGSTAMTKIAYEFPTREKAQLRAVKHFQDTLVKAKEANIPLTLLSLDVSTLIDPFDVELLIGELRSDDKVLAVRDGAFILLWNADAVAATKVAEHIRTVLMRKGYSRSRFGMAHYPEDGTEIELLITKSEKALR